MNGLMERMDLTQMGMEECMRKLREDEMQQLSEIRLKRLAHEERLKKNEEIRQANEELNKLKEKEKIILNKLKEKKRKTLELEIEASSWEQIARTKSEELQTAENALDGELKKIWLEREKFCSRVEPYLQNYQKISKKLAMQIKNDTAVSRYSANDVLDSEIISLKEKIVEGQKLANELQTKLALLENEKNFIMKSEEDERKRLAERTEKVRARCIQLKLEIDEKKKNNTENEVYASNGLFSFVRVEDVRRLSGFNVKLRNEK